MTYIVECAVCQQPWDVPEPLVSAPPLQAIQLPAHPIIERADSARDRRLIEVRVIGEQTWLWLSTPHANA